MNRPATFTKPTQLALITGESANVGDVIETENHFRCVDLIIDAAKASLTEKFIKELHTTLKAGTIDSRQSWFAMGAYKKCPMKWAARKLCCPKKWQTGCGLCWRSTRNERPKEICFWEAYRMERAKIYRTGQQHLFLGGRE